MKMKNAIMETVSSLASSILINLMVACVALGSLRLRMKGGTKLSVPVPEHERAKK